jgi:hypothetical protein
MLEKKRSDRISGTKRKLHSMQKRGKNRLEESEK